jgi:hypothetical protein
MTQMDLDNTTGLTQNPEVPSVPNSNPPNPTWTNYTMVSALSNDIFHRLQQHQQTSQEAVKLEEGTPTYEKL